MSDSVTLLASIGLLFIVGILFIFIVKVVQYFKDLASKEYVERYHSYQLQVMEETKTSVAKLKTKMEKIEKAFASME